MKFLIVLVLAAGINAETSADMAKRIMNLGQTFCTETEVSNLCKCMETPVYQQQPVKQLENQALGCAASKVNPLKYANGMNQLNQFNTCIKPGNWSELLDRVYEQAYPVFGPLLEEMNSTLTSWKKAGKAQATCISDGYKMILNKAANATLIDNICKKIVNMGVISKAEWKCVLQYAPVVLDLSKYSCAKLTPPKK